MSLALTLINFPISSLNLSVSHALKTLTFLLSLTSTHTFILFLSLFRYLLIVLSLPLSLDVSLTYFSLILFLSLSRQFTIQCKISRFIEIGAHTQAIFLSLSRRNNQHCFSIPVTLQPTQEPGSEHRTPLSDVQFVSF